MTSARITVLTSGPLCRNPRVHKEAATLALAGHDVTVATVAQHPRFEAYDDVILRDAPFRKVVVNRCPGRLSTRAFSFVERALAHALRRARVAHPAALGPYHALRRLARSLPCDLLIAHTELPFCIAAELLASGAPVSADVEDWHSRDLLAADRAARPLDLLARAEATLLRRARHVTTTSRAMATGLAAAYDAPTPQVLPNTFPLSPPPAARSGTPALFWFSQTIGPGRGLEPFLAAWALSRAPSRLVLLGDISPGYDAHLLGTLPPERRAAVEFLPLVAPAALPALIGRHHLGLALEPRQPANKDLTISNKIFHYLDAGVAVLATPTAGQSEVFARDPGIGLLDDLSDPAALASRLDALLLDPERLALHAAAARRLAEREYCWEKNSRVLLAAVAGALNAGKPAARS